MTQPGETPQNPHSFNPNDSSGVQPSPDSQQHAPPQPNQATPYAQQQFPQQQPPQQQPNNKRGCLIAVLIGLIALLLVGGIAVFGAAYYLINEQKSSTTSTTSLAPTNLTPVPITPPNAIDSTVKPGEKNNDKEAALESAKVLAELDYSKQGMFEALINPNIENYTEEAAQYAIDNLNEDWKQNALEKAKIYVEHLGLEKEEIYEQLTSEYGDKFTPEEARYAVDNL